MTVQPGSHVIAAAGIGDDPTVCGLVGFLGVDEDPNVVLDRYVQALRDPFGLPGRVAGVPPPPAGGWHP